MVQRLDLPSEVYLASQKIMTWKRTDDTFYVVSGNLTDLFFEVHEIYP